MTSTDRTIADRVAEFDAGPATHLPADALATFSAERAALAGAAPPAGVIAPGTPMPDGDLLTADGTATSLAAARAGRPAVVVFYRGAWCPYCNLTLRAYQEHVAPALAERGVAFVALSPQKPDGSLTMSETNALSFAVLSDPGNQVAGALGILTASGDDVRAAQASLGVDVAAGNADGTATIPMPTVVVVDAAGVVRWIDVHPDYSTRTEPGQILDAVAALD